MAEQGASNNELLLAACRNDQKDALEEILESENYDIHYTDGAGNTAAHLAAKSGALDCLEDLVNLPDIDLNIKNRIEGNTPLHYAVGYQDKDEELAYAMVDILLQGGADVKIENRNKVTPSMMVHSQNKDLAALLAQSSIANEVDDADIANDDEYGSDEDDQPSD